MKISHSKILLDCVAGRPSYHDIRDELLDAVKQAEVKDGILVAASAHTTCSLYFDETMHDKNYFGDEYLQVYFVDWDQLRERKRTVHVIVMGK